MFQVSASYPSDAIFGADFLTGAAARKVVDVDAGGEEFTRPEVIVVCERDFRSEELVEGRVCLSETTIRSLGQMVGLHGNAEWVRLERRARFAERDLVIEKARNERLREAIDTMNALYAEHPLADAP